MTDNEIIKALECCSKITFSCDGCPLKHLKYSECYELVIRSTLNLINRQKAEVESKNDLIHRQSDVISEQKEKLERIYAEVVKEFAERLKKISDIFGDIPGWRDVITNEMDIDNLVKEMLGDE